MVETFDDVYFVFSGGRGFRSRLVPDIDTAFDTAVEFAFGDIPDPVKEPELWDEFEVMKNDFENREFWKEGGALWETDYSSGWVVVVKVETRLM